MQTSSSTRPVQVVTPVVVRRPPIVKIGNQLHF